MSEANTLSKRCVCGKSETFPICDGSHRSEAWVCTATEAARHVGLAILAGPRLINLAQQVASALGGVVAVGPLHTTEAVVITDGLDIAALSFLMASVQALSWRVISLDLPHISTALQRLDPSPLVVQSAPIGSLWRRVVASFQEPRAQQAAVQLPRRVFLSHATADELQLLPAVQYLRSEMGHEVFFCLDAIPTSSLWFAEVQAALDHCSHVVLAVSAASRSSTFCAFEFGYALAKQKPIGIVSLDGSALPAWAQHLQAIELPRLGKSKPWLSHEEALIDALLCCLVAAGER